MEAPSEIRIVVASHKPYWMPGDPAYVPVQVGAAGKGSIPGFQRDDEGDNISSKNPGYCELTGLYWAWRNLDAAYLGLAHYRRHFAEGRVGPRRSRVAAGARVLEAARATGVVLPRPRDYLVETNYSQYAHAHRAEDLELAREVIAGREPGTARAFDEVMGRTRGHRFNMFAMRRDLADGWCGWLFGVLGEMEGRLGGGYSGRGSRVYGFVAERLLDVWLESRGLAYEEMPVVHLEGQHWARKGAGFLRRKASSRAR